MSIRNRSIYATLLVPSILAATGMAVVGGLGTGLAVRHHAGEGGTDLAVAAGFSAAGLLATCGPLLILLHARLIHTRVLAPVITLQRVFHRRLNGDSSARADLPDHHVLAPLGRALDRAFDQFDQHRGEARRLAMVANLTNKAVVLTDQQGRVQWCNQAYTRMTGYHLADMLGRKPGHLLQGPDTDPSTVQVIRRQINAGRPFEFELLNYHRDGRAYWVHVEAQPIHDADGALVGFMSIQSDITQRKQREQRLDRSQCELRTLLDHVDQGLLLHQWPSGELRFVSAGFRRLWGGGVEPSGDGGRGWLRAVHPDDRQAAADEFARAAAEGRGFDLTYRIVGSDGSLQWMRDRGVVVGEGGQESLLVRWVEDVTKYSHDNVQLEQMRAALEHMCDPAFHVSLSGRFIWGNDAGCRLLGHDREQLLRMQVAEVDPMMGPTAWGETLGMLEASRSLRFDTELMRADGSRVPVEVMIALAGSPSGGDPGQGQMDTPHIFAVVRDATGIRQKEAELGMVRDAAEREKNARSSFLAGIGHDIRSALTAILACADLARERAGGDDELLDHMRAIQRNGRQMLDVVGHVLDLSMIEAGRMTVDRLNCSPLCIAREVVRRMRPRATAKNLALRIECDPPLPRQVRTDPSRLRQMLTTLLDNAIRWTDRGRVTMRLALATPPDAPEPRLRIEVADTGVGIPPSVCERLFEPFTGEDGLQQQSHQRSTGLGLVVARHLARALGGDLTVTSEVGTGSRFSLEFETGPLAAVELLEDEAACEDEGAPSPAEAAVALHGRVLLVEDDADNRRLMGLLLGRCGLDVELVADGHAAVEKALEAAALRRAYDVIIMDMQMPKLDGCEAARRLRDRGYTGTILALTGRIDPGARARCLAAGCDDFATKPIDRDSLMEQLKHHLPGGQRRVA